MIRANLYNPFTMQDGRSQAIRRRALCASMVLVCLALFAFGTAAKLAQYWPDVNTKLQISNSCKIEKYQDKVNCDRLVVAEMPVALIVVQEPRVWPVPAESEHVSIVSLVRFISFRPPPPSQL